LAARDNNDDNRQQTPPPGRQPEVVITPATLADRRSEYIGQLSLAPDETGSYVSSNRYFYEIDREDFTPEQGRIKHNSFDVLYGDRSPNFEARDIVIQRDVKYLDPLNRFYSMGMDKDFKLLSDTPLETDDDAPGGLRRLTLEAQSSVNINFNLGGYMKEASTIKPRGISVKQAEEWRNSFQAGRRRPVGEEDSPVFDQDPAATPRNVGNAKGAYKSLEFAAGYPSGSTDSNPFNFAKELVRLAKQGQLRAFEDLDEVLDFFERNTNQSTGNDIAEGDWHKTMLIQKYRQNFVSWDTPGQQGTIWRPGRRGGYSRIAEPSARMKIILDELEIPGGTPWAQFTNFYNDRENFLMERGGTVTDPDQVMHPRVGRNATYGQRGTPYVGYNHTLHAVFKELAEDLEEDEILDIAEKCLLPSERIALVTGKPPITYEFYDFQTTTKFVNDPYTRVLNELPGTRQSFEASIQRGAYITSEYNYGIRGYENALARIIIPEAALPNMYVYQLAAGRQTRQLEQRIGNGGWDDSPAGRELQGNYDRLVRLGEFITGSLPRISEGGMKAYFMQYGRVMQNKNLTVDLTSELARRYYNITTDAGSMNLYSELNHKKYDFPWYVELGIPMIATGTFGDLVSNTLTTTGLVNSVTNMNPNAQNFKVTSYGIIAPRGTDTIGEEEDDTRERQPEVVRQRGNLKVYNFDRWAESVQRNIGNNGGLTDITTRGPVLDQNGGPTTAEAWFNMTKRVILSHARDRMVTYKELLRGQKVFSDSETILFKLVKYEMIPRNANRPRGPFRKTILQNYFFANISTVDMIDFVDTQVKYDKYYHYELHAYDVVYGSKFEFRTRVGVYPPQRRRPRAGQPDAPEPNKQACYFSFNVNTKPNVKIVEYPINSDRWKASTATGRGGTYASNQASPLPGGRPDEIVGGVNYPRVRVQAYPPLDPQVTLFSYKGHDNKLLINLAPTPGEYLDSDALNYTAFNNAERASFRRISEDQRTGNPLVPPNKVQFRETPMNDLVMMIYRTDKINPNVGSYKQLYESFSGKLHKLLDQNPMAPMTNQARAYDFIDDVEPNKKYYYTFRTMNFAKQVSNPSPIYEVELQSDEGFKTAVIQEYVPPISTAKTPSKKMTKRIEIKAADIQSLPYQETSQALGAIDTRTGYFSSFKSLINQAGTNGILNNKFVVRLTSRDTGRKIDIAIEFDSSEKRMK
jgi:hypothetical protein